MPVAVQITIIIAIAVLGIVGMLASVAKQSNDIELQKANKETAEALLKLMEHAEKEKSDGRTE